MFKDLQLNSGGAFSKRIKDNMDEDSNRTNSKFY